jgi:hypothetical protein
VASARSQRRKLGARRLAVEFIGGHRNRVTFNRQQAKNITRDNKADDTETDFGLTHCTLGSGLPYMMQYRLHCSHDA